MLKKLVCIVLCMNVMYGMEQKARTFETKMANALFQLYTQKHITTEQFDTGNQQIKTLCTKTNNADKFALNLFDELDTIKRSAGRFDQNMLGKMQDVLIKFFNVFLPPTKKQSVIHLNIETLEKNVDSSGSFSLQESPIVLQDQLFDQKQAEDDYKKLTRIIEKLHQDGEISSYRKEKLLEEKVLHKFHKHLYKQTEDIHQALDAYYQAYIEPKKNNTATEELPKMTESFITAVNDFFNLHTSQQQQKPQTHKKTLSSEYFACSSPSVSAGLDILFDFHDDEKSPRISTDEEEVA